MSTRARARSTARTVAVVVAMSACGGKTDAMTAPAPSYSGVDGSYKVTGSFDAFLFRAWSMQGTLTLHQPSTSSSAVTGTAAVALATGFPNPPHFNQVFNGQRLGGDSVQFTLRDSTLQYRGLWYFTGVVSGARIVGVHSLESLVDPYSGGFSASVTDGTWSGTR